MLRRYSLVTAVALFAAIPLFPVGAQAPIAGSGALPQMNPEAQSPPDVIEAVGKLMSIRRDRGEMHEIKGCFRRSRLQATLRQICRQRLKSYFGRMMLKHRDIFANSKPLELFIRFIEVSGDPESNAFRKDLFSLRGIIGTIDEAQRFRQIKECFQDAGPQPAIQQFCRQRLDAFQGEILRTRGVELRDISPAAIRRRLLTVATSDQVGFLAGDTTAFESLRNIRKAQQEKKIKARTALVTARRSYCQVKTGRRAVSLTSLLSDPGICLCTYGRRYATSDPGQQSRPVRVAPGKCSAASRLRVGDLNGGRLRHHDWVTLQAVHNGYLSMNRDGIVYANRSQAGKSEKFRIIRAANTPGIVRAGELIVLVSARGVFVVPDLKNGRLKATKKTPLPHEYFVLTPN